MLRVGHEPGNYFDRYAVCLKKSEAGIVGHVPRQWDRLSYYFLLHGRRIICGGNWQAEVRSSYRSRSFVYLQVYWPGEIDREDKGEDGTQDENGDPFSETCEV